MTSYVLHTTHTSQPILDSALAQNVKKQDFVLTGSYESNEHRVYWIINCDGHGSGVYSDLIINFIRSLDLDEIMKKDDPAGFIKSALPSNDQTTHSGSTASLIKIFPDKAIVWWIGDSEIMISDGETTIFKNTKHDLNNQTDLGKLEGIAKLVDRKKNKFVVIDDHTMDIQLGGYLSFVHDPYSNTFTKMNMTRALGHCSITDTIGHFERAIIPFEKDKKYTVVAYSDGVGDILQIHGADENFILTEARKAKDIVDFAKKRWTQEWKCKGYGDHKTHYPKHHIDDISCALFKQTD
jgi:hypothetical protein